MGLILYVTVAYVNVHILNIHVTYVNDTKYKTLETFMIMIKI